MRENFEKFILNGFAEGKGKTLAVDRYAVIAEHVRVLRTYYSEQWLTLYMRKHLLWYTQDLVGSASLRARIATSDSIDESLKILKEAFK